MLDEVGETKQAQRRELKIVYLPVKQVLDRQLQDPDKALASYDYERAQEIVKTQLGSSGPLGAPGAAGFQQAAHEGARATHINNFFDPQSGVNLCCTKPLPAKMSEEPQR